MESDRLTKNLWVHTKWCFIALPYGWFLSFLGNTYDVLLLGLIAIAILGGLSGMFFTNLMVQRWMRE